MRRRKTLESYLSGRWSRGEGVETTLVDPVTGDALATASARGLDLAGALDFARREGQGALRGLGYAARAKLVGAVADVLVANRAKYEAIAIANSGNTKSRCRDRHRRRHRHAEILRAARRVGSAMRARCLTRSRCGSPRRRTTRPST